jgi:hypothetical protein
MESGWNCCHELHDELNWSGWGGIMRRYLFAASVAVGTLILSIPAAQAGTGGEQPPPGVVSPTPASGTPQLVSDGSVDIVRQLVQCGGTMYAVGRFTQIKGGSTTYSRNNAFSFSATAPFTVTSWNPNVNGQVNSIAFTPDCSQAYLGGQFTSVNGTAVNNIAEVSTSTGAVNTAFGHSAGGQVETLLTYNGHLLTGGYFKSINNSSADPYFTSLNPVTGKNDGFLHLSISGNYQFTGVGSNPTRVNNQQLSHGGTLDLVEGDFTSVGGLPRKQIFMLDLSGSTATVTPWTSPEFSQDCWTSEPFYLQAASWSPNDSEVYVATTGFHPWNGPADTGLCDAAAAFPASQSTVSHSWINYTGCDSLFATAADSNAAYFGGHERYSMNPYACDSLGSGAYNAPGMEGLDPANGHLYVNSAGTAGYYSRARGVGADDMELTGAGLWIASDNMNNASQCGGVFGHAGICFLPYS